MGTDQLMAQTINGISSMATRNVLVDLAEQYSLHSDQKVLIESVGGVEAARRIEAGESFDFAVLAVDSIDRLIASGRLVAGSRTDVARSGVAIAVRTGAARPDIESEETVRDAILAARSVGYSTGPSGSHLTRLFERWGIAGKLASRIVQAPPGVAVGSLVASGEVELGFQQLSELMHLPGIEVIGPLPPAIQSVTTFSAALCVASVHADAARAFMAFLASAQTALAKLAQGMEPA